MEEISKRATQDRISALPDSLLLLILSSLDMEEVVNTSVLSKRWQYIWTSVPTLKFTYFDSTREGMKVFVEWVNRVILRFQNTSVEKFELTCPYHHDYKTNFDMWYSFVANKNVKELSLQFHIPQWVRPGPWAGRSEDLLFFDSYVKYTLPEDVLCNSSLTNLSIRGCNFVPYEGYRSTCLKNISFSWVNLEDDVIAKILSVCPMLIYLKIFACRVPTQLVIKSESLKELIIAQNYTQFDGKPSLEISTPGLLSFHLSGEFHHLHDNNHPLISMASLQRAELNIQCTYMYGHGFDSDTDYEYGDDGNDDVDEHAMECVVYLGELLLERLKNVEELEMGFQCIQAMLLLEAKGLQSPLLGLKCLKVNANIRRNEVPGIVSLLKCSPNLEKLVVNRSYNSEEWENSLSFSIFDKKVRSYWKDKKWMEEVPLPHLKSVKFMGKYKIWEDVDETTHTLIQLLLKNAPLLAKVVFNMARYELRVTPHFA